MSSSGCDLCDAVRLTTWWYEDDVCWVAECESCGVPMVVWHVHATDPPPAVIDHMLGRLRDVAGEHGPSQYWIDDINNWTTVAKENGFKPE